MTEYKKLVTLVEKLKGDIDTLMQGLAEHSFHDEYSLTSSSPTIERLHGIAVEIKHTTLEAIPRLQKILSRAQETNPDRQIYNEMMCKKIEQLLETFCSDVINRLTPQKNGSDVTSEKSEKGEEAPYTQRLMDILLEDSPVLVKVEALYDQHLLRRAATEAWIQRIATGLSEVVRFEEEGRAVLGAQEKHARARLLEEKASEKEKILEALRQKETEKWRSEETRRNLEHANLQRLSKDLNRHTIHTAINEMIPDPALRKLFAARMFRLTKELLITPEDERIRYLRNNNQSLIQDFAHPCLSCRPCNCNCQAFHMLAEKIWYTLGYEVRYSTNETLNLSVLLEHSIFQDITLPCGRALHEHQYLKMGFEDYSERFLELKEPDAAKNPDAWMVWYGRVREVEEALRLMM